MNVRNTYVYVMIYYSIYDLLLYYYYISHFLRLCLGEHIQILFSSQIYIGIERCAHVLSGIDTGTRNILIFLITIEFIYRLLFIGLPVTKYVCVILTITK